MTTHYKLRDYNPTLVFEKDHPRELRWDNKYKLWMLEDNKKCQGIWLKEKDKLVGEIIVTWDSDNVIHGESITVASDYRRKGIATDLVKKTLEWGENMGFEWFIGEAREGSSWSVFQNLGATPIFLYKNWSGTKEDYMLFKIKIQTNGFSKPSR